MKNEDTVQRALRLTRDRIFRAANADKNDNEYRAALYALQMMRDELRSQSAV